MRTRRMKNLLDMVAPRERCVPPRNRQRRMRVVGVLLFAVMLALPGFAKSGRELLDAGKAAYAQKNYDQAATLFEQAYKKDATLTLALYNKAFALRKAGRFDDARSAYATFLKVVPGDLDGLFGLAETERLLGNDKAAKKLFAEYVKKETRSDKAKYVEYAKKKLAQKAASPAERASTLIENGKQAFAAKKFDKAEQAFAQVLAFDPTNQEALYRRALALRKGGRYVDAIKAYGAFRRQAPRDLDGLFGLAETYRLAGKNDQAKKLFKQYLVAEDRKDRDKYRSYAKEQLDALSGKKPTDAKVAAEKPSGGAKTKPAAKVKASAIAASANLMADGDAAYKKKKYKQAASMYAAARERNPNATVTLYKEALARRKAGELKAARDLYIAFREQKPDDVDALYGLAATYEKMGDVANAAKHYALYVEREKRPSEKKYVEKAKKYVAAAAAADKKLSGRNDAASDAKSGAKAAADAKPGGDKSAQADAAPPVKKRKLVKVTAAHKKAAKALAERAATAYRAKKYGRAADQYAAAFKKNPNEISYAYKRALALRKAGDLPGAQKEYAAFLELAPDDVDALYGLATTCKMREDTACARKFYAMYVEREQRASEKKYVEKAKAYLEETRAAAGAAVADGGEPEGEPVSKHHLRHAQEGEHAAILHEEAGPHSKHGSRHGKNLSVASLIAHGERALKSGDIKSAEEHAAMARALAPNNARATLLLGDVRAAQGNAEAAKKAYTAIAEGEDGTYRRAATDRLAGKMPPALAGAKTAPSSSGPTDAQQQEAAALITQARAHVEQKQNDDALAALDAALKLHPRSYDAQFMRGEIFVERRRGVYALQAYQRALASAPKNAAPLFGIAQAYELIGERRMSKRYYKLYAASKADDVDDGKQREAFLKVEGAI